MVPRGGLSDRSYNARKINDLLLPQISVLYQPNVPASITESTFAGPVYGLPRLRDVARRMVPRTEDCGVDLLARQGRKQLLPQMDQSVTPQSEGRLHYV